MADYLWTNDVERIIQDDYLDNEDFLNEEYERYLEYCQDMEEEPLEFKDWKSSDWFWDEINDTYSYSASDDSEYMLKEVWLPAIFKQDSGHGILGIDMWSRHTPYIFFKDEDDMEEWISDLLRNTFFHSSEHSYIEEGRGGQLWLNRYRLYTFPDSVRLMRKFIRKYTQFEEDSDVRDDLETAWRGDNESEKEFLVREYFEWISDEDLYINADPEDVIESGLLVPIENK